MQIRILGPLEIIDGDRRVSIGAPKQRTLLAALIVRANRVVPIGELAGHVWGEAPPSSARLTLQGYILRLRRALAPLDGVSIVTEPAGYLLRADPGQVDASRFESLLAEADHRARTGDVAAEAALLGEALGLWRGEPLADVESESLRRDEAGRLSELWARAVERRVEADLRLGRHLELIGELKALVAAHPLREEFRAQLMLAMYRSGRRADALHAYQEARRTLVAELGMEPGPRLRRLERAVLVADPALELEPDKENSPSVLPPDVPHFVGREAETARLLAGEETGAGPVVCAVAGMAGVGKTALVLHAAHRLGERYPDGRLYADLGGTGDHPMEPDVALDRFLRLLGVWNGRIPAGTDERAALLRDRLAGRRVLLVLDNAVDEAQVRPLIPGSPGCAVLITSRARLVGLEYARLVDLDVLDAEHAVDLLAGVIGPDRARAEAECARILVAQCGYLPLAVRIVAARLAGHPEWRLGRLTGQLADEHRRLDRLAAGDLEVRSSIAMSHDALAPEHRRPFRLIGLLDLPEVAPWMIAALLDRPSAETEDIVDALVDARLLEASRADADGDYRYRCHDLVRLFARERALATDSREEREAALTRVLETLLAYARRADDALPSRRLRLPESLASRPAPDGAPPVPLAWFEANRATLTVAVRQAVNLGLPELAWRLAAATLNFFDLRGYWDDWGRTHHDALTAAQAHGDLRGETMMRYGLGVLATVRDRYEDAAEHLSAALTGCRELEAPIAEARVLNALGDVHHICDRLDEAFACFQDALELSARQGDLTGAANSLLDLGLVHRDQSRPAESLDHLSRALTTFRAAGDVYGEAHVLRFLAATHYHSRGDLAAARRHATHAIGLFRRLGDDLAEIRSLRLLAMVLAAEDRWKPAIRLLDRCLAAFRERGDLFGEASTLWSLGEATHRAGDTRLAAEHLERALSLFGRLSVPRWEDRTRAELVAVRADGARAHRHARVSDSGPLPVSSRGSG